MSQFYKIKDGVEYSTDYKFFFENQIAIGKSGHRYAFYSRLENKSFHTMSCVFSPYQLDNNQIDDICKRIHKEILEGKHGEGILID